MPGFVEKYVLPLLIALAAAVVVQVLAKWNLQSRVALFIGVTALAYLLCHRLQLGNEATGSGTAAEPGSPTAHPTPTTSATTTIEQNASDSTCSNVVAGKDANVDCSSHEEKPNVPKHNPKSP